MAILERTYNIPLRKEFQKAPMYRRAKKAVIAVREFLSKHMKSADVRLGPRLNHQIWARGIRHPPHHIKVTVTRDEAGVAKAELFGFKWEEKKPFKKKEKKAFEIEHAEEHKHDAAVKPAAKPDAGPVEKPAEKPAPKTPEKKAPAAKPETKAAQKPETKEKKPAAKKPAKKE